jgi:hypothetical protein
MENSHHPEQDLAEGLTETNDPSCVNDGPTSSKQHMSVRMTGQRVDPPADVTYEALKLALSAIRIDIAWHAGAISADAAVEHLEREIVRTMSRYTKSIHGTEGRNEGRPRRD